MLGVNRVRDLPDSRVLLRDPVGQRQDLRGPGGHDPAGPRGSARGAGGSLGRSPPCRSSRTTPCRAIRTGPSALDLSPQGRACPAGLGRLGMASPTLRRSVGPLIRSSGLGGLVGLECRVIQLAGGIDPPAPGGSGEARRSSGGCSRDVRRPGGCRAPRPGRGPAGRGLASDLQESVELERLPGKTRGSSLPCMISKGVLALSTW